MNMPSFLKPRGASRPPSPEAALSSKRPSPKRNASTPLPHVLVAHADISVNPTASPRFRSFLSSAPGKENKENQPVVSLTAEPESLTNSSLALVAGGDPTPSAAPSRPSTPGDKKRLSFIRASSLARLPSAGMSAGISAARKVPKALPRLSPAAFRTTGSGRADLTSPSSPEEKPIGWVRCRVEAASGLMAKDRNGKSDPFVILKVPVAQEQQQHQLQQGAPAPDDGGKVVSEVKAKTLEPVWWTDGMPDTAGAGGAADLTFPVWPSTLATKRIEIVIYDKDKVGKDYLGEVSLGLDEWFAEGWRSEGADALPNIGWLDPANKPQWFVLKSTKRSKVTGKVLVRIGFLEPSLVPWSVAAGKTSFAALSAADSGALSHQGEAGVPPLSIDGSTGPCSVAELAPAIKSLLTDPNLASTSEAQDDASPRRRRWLGTSGKLGRRDRRRAARGERVLTAPPTEGVGTMGTGGDVKGWELSAGIGMGYAESDSSDSDTDASSILSEASEESPEEEMAQQRRPAAVGAGASGSAAAPGTAGASGGTPAVPGPSAPPSAPATRKGALLPSFMRRGALRTDTASSSGSSSGAATTLAPSTAVTGEVGAPSGGGKKRFGGKRKSSGDPSTQQAPVADEAALRRRETRKARRKQRRLLRRRSDYSFQTGGDDDIMGLCFVEIKGAKGLPRWKNMTRTGFDMDPFAIISFGHKVFRTRVIRHSLDPKWDEKLFFHVKRHEMSFSIQISIFDWDKMSSNDFVGECVLKMADLIKQAPQPDPKTGLYRANDDFQLSGDQLFDFELPVSIAEKNDLEVKHAATLHLRAKLAPYAALRQKFWRRYLQQYDTDDSGTISYVELFSMLDSLGSTLSKRTIESFFTRYGKTPDGELTQDEVVAALEEELMKPKEDKEPLDPHLDSGMVTPALGQSLGPPDLSDNANQPIGFTGPNAMRTEEPEEVEELDPTQKVINKADAGALEGLAARGPMAMGPKHPTEAAAEDSSDADNSGLGSPDTVERVINISKCPLCHKDRIDSRMEVDLVTHLAVCASQDWSTLDRIPVGDFVTASQAHRKWFTKVISKVQNGQYQLGANSANIIVQDRLTGQLLEEKMQVYVRAGIRLMYKGLGSSTMEGQRIRRLLHSMSVKQGKKYDAPESVKDIPTFVAFHNLDMTEVRDPLDSFKSFNAFFYRKLREGARPVDNPDDPRTLVSCADCRMMAFPTVDEATRIWIKGREFSVQRLLGERYGPQAREYEGGALAIFRLAPQDYHRFHSPVDGVIGEMDRISGQYYTVNPMAIRSAVDVYGENVRTVVPIDTEAFGRVYSVHIGAMLVGSIVITVRAGQRVKRGEDIGYFAFGGSTIVTVFPPKTVKWDDDLVTNGKHSIETLVRVGMKVGQSTRAV